MAPRESKAGLHLIPGSRLLSWLKKEFKNMTEDLGKHSDFIKTIVFTQEVRVGDLREWRCADEFWVEGFY